MVLFKNNKERERSMKIIKRMLSVVLAVALMLTGLPMYGMEAQAAEQPEGYEYEVNEDGNSVTITEYTGIGGDVVIPSEIDGKKVTSIGDSAFRYRIDVTSIVIPEGVTSIGDSAFYSDGESYESSLASVEIPSSVTSIGRAAFFGCWRLTSIEIPSSVTSIGDRAFEYCRSLESIIEIGRAHV